MKKLLVWVAAIVVAYVAGTSIGTFIEGLSFVDEENASDEEKVAEFTAKYLITVFLSALLGKFVGAGAKALTEDK